MVTNHRVQGCVWYVSGFVSAVCWFFFGCFFIVFFFDFSLTRWEEDRRKKKIDSIPLQTFLLWQPPLLTFAYCLCALFVLGGDTLERHDCKREERLVKLSKRNRKGCRIVNQVYIPKSSKERCFWLFLGLLPCIKLSKPTEPCMR